MHRMVYELEHLHGCSYAAVNNAGEVPEKRIIFPNPSNDGRLEAKQYADISWSWYEAGDKK